MARITIITLGSRGDVQPFLALGSALQSAGHHVVLAAPENYNDFIRDHGVGFYPLEGDFQEAASTQAGRKTLASGNNPFLFIPRFIQSGKHLAIKLLQGMITACKGSDLIILGGLGFYGGVDTAEKLAVPYITAAVQPMVPSRVMQSPFFPAAPGWLPLKETYNILSHKLFGMMFWMMLRPLINKGRKDVLGLPPVGFSPVYQQIEQNQIPSLWGFSPCVVPKPDDWGDWHRMTGYWFLDTPPTWQPPIELVNFLEAGEPPVYIGFGSMSDQDTDTLTETLVQALKLVNRRGILSSGWGTMDATASSGDVFITGPVPHDWLFPRMAAVVHHGGAGTTAAGMRAGIPTVIVPFAADQFFWADQVAKIGAGCSPGSRKKLTAENLSRAIDKVLTDESIRSRANQVGACIRRENGLEQAVNEIERFLT